MDTAFATYQGVDRDALIRTDKELHKDYIDVDSVHWKAKWDNGFTGEDKREDIHKLYYKFLEQVSWEMSLAIDNSAISKMPNTKPVPKEQ